MSNAIDLVPFLPLARRVAGRVWRECGGHWALDELESEAMVGLVVARNKYVPGRSSFATYATYRVRFHLLDWVRANDFLNRGGMAEVKAGKREPARFASIDESHDDSGFSLGCTVAARDERDGTELRDEVEVLLRRIGAADRWVIREHFLRGVTQVKIAQKMGVSGASVSMRISKALKELAQR